MVPDSISMKPHAQRFESLRSFWYGQLLALDLRIGKWPVLGVGCNAILQLIPTICGARRFI